MAYDEYLKRELEARNKAVADMRSIVDAAEAENRDLTPEEDERIAAFTSEAEQRDARMAQLRRMVTAAEVGEQVATQLGTAIARTDESRQSIDNRLADEVRTAFAKGNFQGEEFEVRLPGRMSQAEIRAIADFSDSSSLFPADFSRRVAVYQRTLSPWISLATIINATDGAPLVLPRLTADPTTYTPGEGTAITESSPTLSPATAVLTSYKALAYVSQEAAQDEVIGLMDLIARQQGRALGLAFGSAATTAILAAATNGGTATGTPFFLLDDLISLEYSAAAQYRMGGVWVMANAAISKARKFKDTTGQYLWQPSNIVGQPDTLLGHAVYEDPNLASPASATKSVVFGDASAYVVKQLPLRVAVSTDFKFDTDQVAIKAVYRAGGALPDVAALRYLVSANT